MSDLEGGGTMQLEVSCHCGAVRLSIALMTERLDVRRCNCSYCRMRGNVVVSIPLERILSVTGAESLERYRFHTGAAEHHFCRICGVQTHHTRRSDPTMAAINVACIAGKSPFDFASVPVSDGMSHPSDTGRAPRVAGVLHYVPSVD